MNNDIVKTTEDQETLEEIEEIESNDSQQIMKPNIESGVKESGLYTKIKGTTFRENGQDMIQSLHIGQTLLLIPEPENKADPNAIKVMTLDLKHLGYVSKELAAEFKESISKGTKWFAEVKEITGGTEDKNFGCNILIKKYSFRDQLMETPNKIFELENKITAIKFKIEDLKFKTSRRYDIVYFDVQKQTDEEGKKSYTNDDQRKAATKMVLDKDINYQADKKELEDLNRAFPDCEIIIR